MIELRDYQKETVDKVFDLYKQNPHGRAKLVLATGCHSAGQGILMYDGSIKAAETVEEGDLLMGPDSTPRQVLALYHGQDEMMEIRPVKGDSWVVNRGHILSLVQTNKRLIRPSTKDGTICDVSVSDWQKWSSTAKHLYKLFRVGVNFPQQKPLPMHPYLLGALLGDGGLTVHDRIHFTNIDKPVVQEVERIVQTYNLQLHPVKSDIRAQSYSIAGNTGRSANFVKNTLRELELFPIRCEDRFIPRIYKIASQQDRLELLAGLIDTDGSCIEQTGFEFCSKSSQLASDVLFVARSLGLAAYKSPKEINGVVYYRVHISGDCSIIPTRTPRKQAQSRQQKKDVLRTGFTIRPTGTTENYYGFTVDGDNRYLLEDFTVTHNCGKTIIFSAIAHKIREYSNTNVLIVAHRDELLGQAAEKYRFIDPSAVIGKIGGGTFEWGAPVTVASIQTICRPNHLKQLALFNYGVVIIDECHHCHERNEYGKVLEALPNAFKIGVTATDMRLDRRSNNTIFGEAVCTFGIRWAIQHRHLCNLRAKAIATDVSLDDIKTSKNSDGETDFAVGELAGAVDTPARNHRIVDAWKQHADGRRTICFGVTVEHAKHITEAFTEQGVAAATITGETEHTERRRFYKALADGSIKVLSSVQVLTEGFDSPRVNCIITARPTQSESLFTQMVGRGLRLAPGKEDCLLLDITDNCFNHRLEPQNLSKVLGIKLKDNETVTAAEERATSENAEKLAQVRTLQTKRLRDQEVDLLGILQWQERNGMFVLEVGREKHRIALVPSEEAEGYTVWARLFPGFEPQAWIETPMSLDWAQQSAEAKAKMLLADPKSVALVDRSAPWRSQKVDPESNQIKFLKWKKIPWNEDMTKGEASDLIDDWKRRDEEKKAARAARQKARISA